MPHYLPPNLTKDCQCRGNPMRAFWCPTGHMLECHYPLDCRVAACNHLHKYDFPPEQVRKLQEGMDQVFATRADPECPQCRGQGFREHLVSLAEMGGSSPIELPLGAEMVNVLGPCECLKPWEVLAEEYIQRGLYT